MRLCILSKIIIGVFLTLILSACSTPTTKSLSMIPEDANLVYKVNLGVLLQKVDVKGWYKSDLLKEPLKRVRSSNRKAYRMISNVVEKPETLGIDLGKSIFIYFIEESEDEKYFCVALDLNSEDKFKSFLDNVIDKMDAEADMEEAVGYKYYLIDGEVGIGWDQDKALLIFPDSYASRENIDFELENLMTLNEQYSIKSSELLYGFCHSDKDISMMVNTNLLEGTRQFRRLENLYDFDLEDNIIVADLEFTKEHVLFNSKFIFNDEIQSFIEEYNILESRMNEAMLKYLPQESFFLTSLSFNPTGCYELLANEDDFDAISFRFKRTFGFDIKDIFDKATGNLALAIHDFEEVEHSFYNGYNGHDSYKETIPTYSIVMETKDPSLLEDVINSNASDGMLKKRKKYYEINRGRETIYLAFNEKYISVTNDKKAINTFTKGGYTTSFQNSELKGYTLNNNVYMFWDLDYDNYPNSVKKKIRKSQGRKGRVAFKTLTKLFKYASMQQTKNSDVSIKIGLKEFALEDLEPLMEMVE